MLLLRPEILLILRDGTKGVKELNSRIGTLSGISSTIVGGSVVEGVLSDVLLAFMLSAGWTGALIKSSPELDEVSSSPAMILWLMRFRSSGTLKTAPPMW